MQENELVKGPSTLQGLKVIQDIEEVVSTLKQGETVARFEYGSSMRPIFESGQYARLRKLGQDEQAEIGDAVFCKVCGYWMTHMVWMKNRATGYYLIGSSSGEMYGWTNEVLAIATPMPFIEEPMPFMEEVEETAN